MASFLLVIFIVGLELFCLTFGLGMSQAENVPDALWSLWRQALLTIPLAGFAAVWLRARRTGRRAAVNRAFGIAAALIGSLLSFYWVGETVLARNATRAVAVPVGMPAGMAVTASLLLLSAGLSLLIASSRPGNRPNTP